MTGPDPRGILEALPGGAAILDETGRFLATSSEFARLARRTVGELLGAGLFDVVDPAPGIRAAHDRFVLSGVGMPIEVEVRRFATIAGEYRLRFAPFRDGERPLALVLAREGSAERRPEETARALDDTLRVVSDVRHEINNALMGLIGHMEILAAQPDLPSAIRRRVETIAGEVERIRVCAGNLSAIRKT